jgi:hypothetical protein
LINVRFPVWRIAINYFSSCFKKCTISEVIDWQPLNVLTNFLQKNLCYKHTSTVWKLQAMSGNLRMVQMV